MGIRRQRRFWRRSTDPGGPGRGGGRRGRGPGRVEGPTGGRAGPRRGDRRAGMPTPIRRPGRVPWARVFGRGVWRGGGRGRAEARAWRNLAATPQRLPGTPALQGLQRCGRSAGIRNTPRNPPRRNARRPPHPHPPTLGGNPPRRNAAATPNLLPGMAVAAWRLSFGEQGCASGPQSAPRDDAVNQEAVLCSGDFGELCSRHYHRPREYAQGHAEAAAARAGGMSVAGRCGRPNSRRGSMSNGRFPVLLRQRSTHCGQSLRRVADVHEDATYTGSTLNSPARFSASGGIACCAIFIVRIDIYPIECDVQCLFGNRFDVLHNRQGFRPQREIFKLFLMIVGIYFFIIWV